MARIIKPTLNKADALAFANKKQPAQPQTRVFTAPEGFRRLTINLPMDLHKKLKLSAVNRDVTATDIIINLLEEELK